MSVISRDLWPALYVVNIPAFVAALTYFLRSDDETDENNSHAVYDRKDKTIRLIETVADWQSFWGEAEMEVNRTKVIGFDCEWVSESLMRREGGEEGGEDDNGAERKIDGRVSLIQIATVSGICGLVRILKIDFVPETLKEVLSNRNILKLGVSPKDDGNRLGKDHG